MAAVVSWNSWREVTTSQFAWTIERKAALVRSLPCFSPSLFPRYKSVNRKRPLTPAAARIDVSRCFCAKVKREIYNSFPRLRPIINRCAPLERTSPDRQAGYTCGGGEGVAQLYANYGRNPWSLGIAGLSSAIVAANATAGLSGFAVPRQWAATIAFTVQQLTIRQDFDGTSRCTSCSFFSSFVASTRI